MALKVQSFKIWKNACEVRPVKNRRIIVSKIAENTTGDNDVHIEFTRMDLSEEEKAFFSSKLEKGKILYTPVRLERKSAMVLMVALQKYFEHIDPITEKDNL